MTKSVTAATIVATTLGAKKIFSIGVSHQPRSTMTLSLTYEKSEQLIRLLTDGLVGIKDMTGEFLLKCESAFGGGKKFARLTILHSGRWNSH